MDGFIITFCTILGAVIAYYTFYQKYVKGPQEIKNYSISKIQFAKNLNQEFLAELKEYVKKRNTNDEHFMQGFSFRESIEMLETYEKVIFSEENLDNLRRVNGTSKALEDVTKKAEEHALFVTQCRNYFRKFNLKEDWHYQ